ncbi:hypothetical protein KEJ18_01895 [Candidatus Bathyarchaeota archaeon]|nr:hypothetical protein [Candidatus Bathyarchaeota archaeon]
MINAPSKRFHPSEIVAIIHFAHEGEGLFLMGEWHGSQHQGVAEALNPLAAFFGIQFNKDTVCDPDDYWVSDLRYPIIQVFLEHYISTGIERIYYYTGCSFEKRQI